ncbi:MAG: membrane protein insertion efficiency factor YidD [Deltaproteobacteria bacterium]|nr:membrane protein insertion efficiency factor YidD [Deltaproteobacteria bacterium]MBI2975117.1 membrane protein insertion efficiency factor YidD [Deltaproteobacteria bacterium]
MAKKISILALRLYQKIISPVSRSLGAECRFYPSCSNYAIAAFSGLSWWKAFYLTFVRLLKCGPWHEGGVDKI